MSPSGRSCVSCSTPVPQDALFCPACGAATPTAFDPATGSPVPAQDTDSTRPTVDVLVQRRAQLQHALGEGFELRELVGQGGFGEVWAAWDVRLKRDVAVKVLLADLAASPGLHQRFAREAEAAARLRHPNIVPIYQVGEADRLAYIVMPLVRGESLRAVMVREGALPIPEGRRILREAALALEAAHRAGIIHRDVKPENIMLEGDERRVLLMDFGIARAAEAEGARLTGTGLVIGTPQYMSPEQATAEKHIDHRSDIYSLGVVAFEALTGRLPFDAESSRDLIVQHLTAEPKDPRGVRPEIPEELADAVLKCLGKTPGERFASAGALADVFQPPVTVSVENPLVWLGKKFRVRARGSRRRMVVYAVFLVAALGTLAVYDRTVLTRALFYWTHRVRPSATAPDAPRSNDPESQWRVDIALGWDVGSAVAALGDTLLVVRSPGNGPETFDGNAWKTLEVRGEVVLPPLAFGGARWLYAWEGAHSIGYELTAAGAVARDTVRGRVNAGWSRGTDGLLGLYDGGMLRGRPGNWRREPTGTGTRLATIWGDRQRQVALGYFGGGPNRPDSLLVYNGLNWRTVDGRPDTTRHWVYNAGAVLADGTLLVVGSDCGQECRGLIAAQLPGADQWRTWGPQMPHDVVFTDVLATGGDTAWVHGQGPGCADPGCLFRVSAASMEPVPNVGRSQIIGLGSLRRELVALTTAGLLWVRRGGQWGVLSVVPGSELRGLEALRGVSYTSATVAAPGVVGARRMVASVQAGSATTWYEGRPTVFYRFQCQRGVALEFLLDAGWDNVAFILDGQGRHLAQDDDGGGRGNARVRWTCPDDGSYQTGVRAFGFGVGGAFRVSLRADTSRAVAARAPEVARAGAAGEITLGATLSGSLDAGVLLSLVLSDGGTAYERECAANDRCTLPAAVAAPGQVVDITRIGQQLVLATADRILRRERTWEPMPVEGAMGEVIALAPDGDSVGAALTADAVWLWRPGVGRWQSWRAVPGWVGRPRRMVISPDGRLGVVIGEAATALLRDSDDALDLRTGSTPPSDAVFLLDGRLVLAEPSSDPLVAGRVVVYDAARGNFSSWRPVAARGTLNVFGLLAGPDRLRVAASGWTVLSIGLRDLPFAPDSARADSTPGQGRN